MSLSESYSMKNDYSFKCEKVNLISKYSLCLMMLSLGRENNWEKAFESCRPHIRDGSCPAMRMRKEEVKAGHVIYYEGSRLEAFEEEMARRKKIEDDLADARNANRIDKTSESYLRGLRGESTHYVLGENNKKPQNTVAKKPDIKPDIKPAIKPIKKQLQPAPSLEAELVNILAKKAVVEKTGVPVVISTQSIKPRPGEKPMDFRKRLLESRSNV